MMGLSTSASISLGIAFVAGKNRVPKPAAGKTALRTFILVGIVGLVSFLGVVSVAFTYGGPPREQPECDARRPQRVGELSPSRARRTILMGAPPWRMKSSWNFSSEKAAPSFFRRSARS